MIPPEQYSFIFDHMMLALILITLASYAQGGVKGFNRLAGVAVPIFLILYIGTRPISGVFVDMVTYAQSFEVAANTGNVYYADWLFNALMLGMSQVTTVDVFFVVCAMLYVLPIAAGLARRHGGAAFSAMLATITSFSFFTYGVNGIRNGIATSILLAAFAWSDRKFVFILLAVAATGTHSSVAVPALFYLLTFFNQSIVLYSCLWLATLFFTLVTSGAGAVFISNLLSSSDDGRVGYLTQIGEDKGGFRFDFILYSIVPIIISYSWAKAHTRQDPFYRRLLCSYLATNAFWVLVMYAAYSNRFAYLSWFMMPWLIVYPFIPNKGGANHPESEHWDVNKFTAMLVGQFALTYLFDIIIYPNR
jgi:hypothetical protein